MAYNDLEAAFRLPQPGFDPRATPIKVPGVAFDSAPYTTPRINVTWRGHLIGLLSRLLLPNAWDGTEAEIETAIQETSKLITGLLHSESGGTMTYPNQAVLFHAASHPGYLSPHEVTALPWSAFPGFESLIQPFGHVAWNLNPSQGDTFTQKFYLAAGSYDFRVLGLKGPFFGTVHWALNGTLIGTQDWYETTVQAEQWQSIEQLTISTPGLQTLVGTMATKNPASSGYWQSYTVFMFRLRPIP